MTIKRIIPCLDVNNGRVVKGVKFQGLKDAGDPLELARRYITDGADELAFLDISATNDGRATTLDVVRKIAAEISIPFCVGGGIRTVKDMDKTIKAGASKVSVCSSALLRPELLSEMAAAFGRECVVIAIDAKRVRPDSQPEEGNSDARRWHAFSGGGKIDTGLDAVEWAKKAALLGAGEIMLTSIDADGTGAGYDLELCGTITRAVQVPVIASGGAGSLEQIAELLKSTEVSAALVASLLHFGESTVKEIKEYLKSRNIQVHI